MTKRIAPRLLSGRQREGLFSRLPGPVKDGLRAIARDERKSVSWVVEETVTRYFKLRAPRYVERRLRLVKGRRAS